MRLRSVNRLAVFLLIAGLAMVVFNAGTAPAATIGAGDGAGSETASSSARAAGSETASGSARAAGSAAASSSRPARSGARDRAAGKRAHKRRRCSRRARRSRASRRAARACRRASRRRSARRRSLASRKTENPGKGRGKNKPPAEEPAPEEPAPDPAPEEPSPEPDPTPEEPAPEPDPTPEEPAPEPEPTPEEPAPTPEPTPEEPAPTPEPDPTAPGSIFWGGWIGDQLTGHQAPWDMSAVTTFEGLAEKKLSIVHYSAPFANCGSSTCSYYSFPTGPMQMIRDHGAIPFYSWASQSTPSTLNEPDFELSDVIEGRYDSFIRGFATAAKTWGHPFFLRFNWEMNGRWFPWSEGVNGNESGEYVTAWRHVHDIFTAVGATNATWVWCPNIDPDNIFRALGPLYPGDAYVDWTCLDGYNWGTNPAKPDRWRSFDNLYKSTYDRIVNQIAPSKPMIIGEVASTEYGGSKASWIRDTLARVPAAYPKIRGFLWFEKYDDGMDWPIETSSSAVDAFAAGIGDPAFATNSFGSLGPGKIQPPG